MYILNKVGEFFAPPPNEFEEFQKDCDTSISVLKSLAVDRTQNLKSALTRISEALQSEIATNESIKFNYFIENSILLKIANEITSNLPSEHLEPALKFFLSFINTNLNIHLPQISIHVPITKILSKLESLNHKCPKETYNFACDVWAACLKQPILLEVLVIQREGQNSICPLLDFFCAASFTLSEIGLKSRDFLLFLFCTPEGVPPFDEQFHQYVTDRLYPQFVSFLISVSGFASTIQFDGSMSATIKWIDQLIFHAGEFPIQTVLDSFISLSNFKRNLAVSFFLSFFSQSEITDAILKYSTDHISDIIDCLKSNDSTDINSALTLLKTLISFSSLYPILLPPSSGQSIDILSLIPQNLLIQNEGSTSIDAYIDDAAQRILSFRNQKEPQREHGDNTIYKLILNTFTQFSQLSIHTSLELTKLLSLIMAIAPDLMNEEFATVFSAVIQEYNTITPKTLKIDDNTQDSPELRASILVEFGKEIHGTFIAFERLKDLDTNRS